MLTAQKTITFAHPNGKYTKVAQDFGGGKDKKNLYSIENQSLKVKLPAEKAATGSTIMNLSIGKNDKYTLSYKVKFPVGFPFKKGGKLPGLAGGKHYTGGQGLQAINNGDGWSFRVMWRGGNSPYLEAYIYYKGMPKKIAPNGKVYGQSVGKFPIQAGKTYTVQMSLQMNTGSQKNGFYKLTVNNQNVCANPALWSTKQTKIDRLAWHVFRGGPADGKDNGNKYDWVNKTDTYVYFDDVVMTPGKILSTAPLGQIAATGGTAAVTPPVTKIIDFNKWPNGAYTKAQYVSDFKGDKNRLTSNNTGKLHIENKMMKVTLQPNKAVEGGTVFGAPLAPSKKYTLSYKVKFQPKFTWKRGGKLPGLTGGHGYGGGNGRARINGDGWSFRLMWAMYDGVNGNKPYLKPYVYYKDMPEGATLDETYGDTFDAKYTIKSGVWHKIQINLTMNTGTNNDGAFSVYVDGKQAFGTNKIRWATEEKARVVDGFAWAIFRGGPATDAWVTNTTEHIYIDDISFTSGDVLGAAFDSVESGEGELTVEERAEIFYQEALETKPSAAEIQAHKGTYTAPTLVDIDDTVLTGTNSGPSKDYGNTAIADSQGTITHETVAAGDFVYQEHNETLPDVPSYEPADYANKIDNALKAGEAKAKNIIASNPDMTPYYDNETWKTSKAEAEILDNYTKANRATTSNYGSLLVTTNLLEEQRKGKLAIVPKILDFNFFRDECKGYPNKYRINQCNNKIDYLEQTLKTINEVILSYDLNATDINQGVAEQIMGKYYSISNKIRKELNREYYKIHEHKIKSGMPIKN